MPKLNIKPSKYVTTTGGLTRDGMSLTLRINEAYKRGDISPTPSLTSFCNIVIARCQLSPQQWFTTFAETHTKSVELELLQSELGRLERMFESVRRSSHGVSKSP